MDGLNMNKQEKITHTLLLLSSPFLFFGITFLLCYLVPTSTLTAVLALTFSFLLTVLFYTKIYSHFLSNYIENFPKTKM
jgi:hypothetical protein